jgi:riboflavin synthase
MFTGLVVERGRVAEAPAASGRGGRRLVVAHGRALAERLPVGASVAVAGVCLTVVERSPDGAAGAWSALELSPETLGRTTLGDLDAGDEVNLEPALRVGDPLGGHWVQGHIDGVGAVADRADAGAHRTLTLAAPGGFGRYLVEKGSVAVDGVSLTVASCAGDRFTVALIPHTLAATTLGALAVGDRVNLEADILAKYVARQVAELVGERLAARPGGADGGEG